MAVSAKVATAYIEFVAQTETFKKACNDANMLVKQTSAKMRADMTEAKGSIALLGEEVGVHLPRHLRTFVAGLPGVSAAMSAAFNAVAVFALAKIVIETGEKIVEFAKKNEESARKAREAWQNAFTPISDTNDKLELTKTKLENAIAKMEGKPQNRLKEAIEEATVAADELGRHLDGDIKKIAGALAEQQHNWFTQRVLGQTGANAAAGIASDAQDKLNQISAGTFRAGPNAGISAQLGDPTAQREFVLRQALADAYAKLGPAQETAARVAANFGGRAPASSSSTEEVRTLTELIAGLKAMQTTSDLTRAIAQDERTKAGLEGGGAGAGGNLGSSVDRPNTSMFSTPIRNLARNLWAELQANMAEAAKADAERAKILADEAWKPYENAASNAAMAVFGGRASYRAPAFSPEAQLSPAAAGAVSALNDLTDAFKDTASQVREILIRSLNQFNSTVVGIMSGDHHASFRQVGQGLFQGASRGLLEHAEGSIMSAFGFGSAGKMGTKGNPMWTKSADSVGGGLAGSAGKGLLGILNDSNWFGSLFGGKLFGAGSVFGGGHALGGSVAAGVPIDVGELGIERFTPMVPGRITPNSELRNGGPLIGYIDARGTDPALTRENFARALAATHASASASASRAIAEQSRRVPR